MDKQLIAKYQARFLRELEDLWYPPLYIQSGKLRTSFNRQQNFVEVRFVADVGIAQDQVKTARGAGFNVIRVKYLMAGKFQACHISKRYKTGDRHEHTR